MRGKTDAVFADAVVDLMHVRPGPGFRRTIANIVGLNLLLFLTFQTEPLWAFVAMAAVTGAFYSAVMMTTHDAIHHTLTGWYWFDEIVARCFSYFVFWPHGTYAELHKMHHRLNGKDARDPEMPTPTVAAWNMAGPLGRWRLRWRLPLSVFVYGGFGMIARHVACARRLARGERRVRRALIVDGCGIAMALVVTVAVTTATGLTWRYVLYLLIVERIVGFFQQLRSHLEHYGLYGNHGSLVETRLQNCRNVTTSVVASQFFNGLNFHSVHHAFPRIPFYHLREAHRRIAALCAAAGRPLPAGEGYVRTFWHLLRAPALVEPERVVTAESAGVACRVTS